MNSFGLMMMVAVCVCMENYNMCAVCLFNFYDLDDALSPKVHRDMSEVRGKTRHLKR
jgi:hypothetical protein